MALFDHQGKTFVVTGGASEMGAICAGKFLEQGAKIQVQVKLSKLEQIDVIVNNAVITVETPKVWRTAHDVNWAIAVLDIAVDQGKALVEKHNKSYPGRVIFVKCDVSSEDDITAAFKEVVAQFKQVDVIINNAGIMVDAPNMWRTACNVNWQGVVSFALKGVKHMSKAEGGAGGTIVNTASIAGITKNPFLPIYCGSKSAVVHFSQCISMEPFFSNTGVRILCMCFGATKTALVQNLDKRPWDLKLGQSLDDSVVDIRETFQSAESAVSAVDYMMKNGSCGSIWLSTDDKPAKDITSKINEAFEIFDRVIADNAK